jgi:hypothetical protein
MPAPTAVGDSSASRHGHVVLHIGFEKTGTKAIQYWLRDHEELLAEHRLRFPRGWIRLNVHQELALTVLRTDRMCMPREKGSDWRDPNWRAHVDHQVAADLARHPDMTTILSSENLDLLRYDDEFERLRALIGDATIVAYLRQPAEWLPRLREQYLTKSGIEEMRLSSDPDAYTYLEPDSWRADYKTLMAKWEQHFTTVRPLMYEVCVAGEGSVIPAFLRYLELPVTDVDGYRLNRRGEPTPRAAGNRALGLRFGDPLPMLRGAADAPPRPGTSAPVAAASP